MTPGTDVSHHQGRIDWSTVALASGVRFAFVRTGDGLHTVDRELARNWTGAKALPFRGPYHFLRCSLSGELQADAMVDAIRSAGCYALSDLPPVCDLEEEGLGAGVAPGRAVDCALAFARRVEQILERAPILYTSPNTIALLGHEAARLAGRFPTLWIAHYGAVTPRVPLPWRAWAFWQHSGSGSCSGVRGPVDLDWFNGEEQDLRDLIEMSKVMASQ